jgi:tripartite ATP-independent transporter DctM subunit
MITETSIVRLFIATVIPGFMLTGMIILYILIRNKVDPTMIIPPKEAVEDSTGANISLIRDLMTGVPIVALVVIIFTLLYTGVATATESAAIGAFSSGIIVLLQRRMTKNCIQRTLLNTVSTSCMILFLMIGGLIFSLFLTLMGLPQALSSFLISAVPNPWAMFILVNVVFIVLGLFLDAMACMMIVLPFLFPVMMDMGFDPVWLGVIVVINFAIGMITPPAGTNLFVIKAVSGVPIGDIIYGVIPYCLIFLLGIVILCLFPGIAMYLPSTM